MKKTSIKEYKGRFVIIVNGEIKGVTSDKSEANLVRARLRGSSLDVFWMSSTRRKHDGPEMLNVLIQHEYNDRKITAQEILRYTPPVRVKDRSDDWIMALIERRSEVDLPLINGRFDFKTTPEGEEFWKQVEQWQIGCGNLPSKPNSASLVKQFRDRWVILVDGKVVGSEVTKQRANTLRGNVTRAKRAKVWNMITGKSTDDARNLFLQFEFADRELTVDIVERQLT